MTRSRLRVGVVGASPARGWFTRAHFPALQALSDRIELAAVCTSRRETAEAAASAYGAARAFDSYEEMAASKDVDLVVVSVRVPMHHQIVSAAIAAGKPLFCEWPLGRTEAEAEDLTARAAAAGIANTIGLQARMAPVLNEVRRLIGDGYVGRVLSTSIVASGFGFGSAIDPDQTYLYDAEAGATMLDVVGGHLLDALCHACGDFVELDARLATRRDRVAVIDVPELERVRAFQAVLAPESGAAGQFGDDPQVPPQRWFTPTSPDQLTVHGQLDSGAVASVHLRGGPSRGTNLLWEINGDEGDIQVTGTAGNIQISPLTLRRGRGAHPLGAPEPMPDDGAPAGAAGNVWRLYRSLLGDELPNGARPVDFAAALQRHRLLGAIRKSSASGQRVAVPRGRS